MAPDVAGERSRLTLTSGAVDAVERLLAQALVRDDAVALEDPCFLASIHTVRLGGYRPIPVPVDAEGMTAGGFARRSSTAPRRGLHSARPEPHRRLSQRDAPQQLREVLAEHPYVLVIEDDYFSFLSRAAFRPIVGPDHRRWALVRSVSKFIGPDLCLAVTATDPDTADRLAMRLSPGTTWVSHLLQRLAHGVLTDDSARELIARAGAHYAARNDGAARLFTAHGLPVVAGDGMSLWVPVPVRRAAPRPGGRRPARPSRLAGAHRRRVPLRSRGCG